MSGTSRFTVEVGKQHIERAQEAIILGRMSTSCVIYQALKDADVFHGQEFGVAYNSAFTHSHPHQWIDLPPEAVKVTNLNEKEWGQVEPFSFDVVVQQNPVE